MIVHKTNSLGKNRMFSPLAVSLFALGIFWLAFFFAVIINNRYFLFGDIAYFSLPWHKALAEALRHGRLPFWLTQIFGGFPLLAEGQAGALYPLTIFFHWFLANEYALSLLLVFHFLLAGLFTHLYARELGMEEAAALLSGLVYAFGGFFITRLMQTSVIFSAAWLPLGLYFLEKYFLARNYRQLLPLAIVIALQCLAGNFTVCWYSLIVYILYFAWFWSKEKLPVKEAGYFTGILLLGLGLAGAQLVPAREFWLNSVNSQPGLSFPLLNLVTYVFPNFFGLQTPTSNYFYYGQYHYWDLAVYIGVAPLILVLVALVFRITKHMNFFIVLCLGAFILSLGQHSQGITGYLFIESFGLAILSGLGLKILLLKKENYSIVLKKIYVWLGKFLLMLFASGYLLILLGVDRVARLAVALGGGTYEKMAVWADQVVGGLQYSLNILNIHLYVQLILLFLIYWVIKGFLFGELKTRVFQAIIVLLVMFDLYYFGVGYNATTRNEQILPSVRLLSILRNDPSYFRIYNYKMPRDYEVLGPEFNLVPNLNMLWNIEEINGYAPRELKAVNELLGIVARTDIKPALPLLGKMNVKYILTTDPIRFAALKEVFHDSRLYVYENFFFKDRAFFVKHAHSQPLITVYQNNEVKIITNNPEPDTLVLMDAYYPGWKAYVDKQSVPVREYDNVFRQIDLPGGKHEVIYRYQPVSWYLGLGLSLLSLAALITLWIFNRLSNKRRLLS